MEDIRYKIVSQEVRKFNFLYKIRVELRREDWRFIIFIHA